jgi:anti-sigma factor RsiW
MRCQDIERLIIDYSERNLSQEELGAIEEHLAQCAACTCFEKDFKNIRTSLQKMSPPTPPEELERRIRDMCHDELSSRLAAEKQRVSLTHPSPVPWIIWAALVSLIGVTAFLLVSLFKNIGLNQPLSFGGAFVIAVILQNAVMLFFTPVIIRKYQSQKKSFRLV